MSIEFSPAFDSGRSSLTACGTGASPVQPAAPAARTRKRLKPRTHGRAERATKAVTARRLAANRRNAKRSTGPRTAAGKQRASRNALKHGLCSRYACLAGECPAAYATFVGELEEELQPRTPLQRALLPHIANLLWRIDRLPQAQAEMFEQELHKCGESRGRRGRRGRSAAGEIMSASQVLARRFSDEPTSNGFLLIGRYERGLHNQLHRLMSRYEWLKKHRATMPIDEDALEAERRRREAEIDAAIDADARRLNAQREAEDARQPQKAPESAARHQPAKRTQSKPAPIPAAASNSRKSATFLDAPATKRTHCGDHARPRREPNSRLSSEAAESSGAQRADASDSSPCPVVALSPCHPANPRATM